MKRSKAEKRKVHKIIIPHLGKPYEYLCGVDSNRAIGEFTWDRVNCLNCLRKLRKGS